MNHPERSDARASGGDVVDRLERSDDGRRPSRIGLPLVAGVAVAA
jgi:hypothetical protein